MNASLPFKTGCRRDGICLASIRLWSIVQSLPIRPDDPHLNQTNVTPIKPLLLGLHRAIRVRLYVENQGDNAYQTQLRVTGQPSLPIQQVESHCVASDLNLRELLCSVGNPFEKGQQKFAFTFDLSTESVGDHPQLMFKFELSTSSNVSNPSQLSSQLFVPIKRFASIDYKR